MQAQELYTTQIKNNLSENYPTIDILDNRTIYSNKSIDPSAKTNSGENNNFYNKMKSYVDKLDDFKPKPWGNTDIKTMDYDNKTLNLVLPYKSLPDFQINALNKVKAHANELNTDVKIYVTSGK